MSLYTNINQNQEDSLKVHNSRATRSMKVTVDGKNLVSHAGTALLSELAVRSGLTEAMSEAMEECGISWHTHDPGVVLTHLAVAIADGADCLADMAALREQDELFGPVASIATAWKDCGLSNLPFESFVRNEAWVATSLIAGALLAWSQMTCFTGALAKAEPKTMRYRVLHVAAILVRRGRGLVMRIDETWPWANDLSRAFTKLRAAIP